MSSHQEISSCLMNFYNNLFRLRRANQPGLQTPDLHDLHIKSLSNESKSFLSRLITDLEIKYTVFAMQPSKAAGPNGFLALFINSIGSKFKIMSQEWWRILGWLDEYQRCQ